MTKVRVLKEFEHDGEQFDLGEVLKVPTKKLADDWIEKGLVEPVEKTIKAPETPVPSEVVLSDPEKLSDMIGKAVAKAQGDIKRPDVEVGREPIDRMTDDDGVPTGGFESINEFVKHVSESRTKGLTEKMKTYDAWRREKATDGVLEETTDSHGGFLAPPSFIASLMEKVWAQAVVSSRCMKVPMGGAMVKIPAIDERSRKDGKRAGGLEGKTIPEGEQFVETNPSFHQVELKPSKKGVLTFTTEELEEDSALPVGTILTTLMSRELSFIMDTEIIRGTGAGQALGILNAAALVTVTRAAGAPDVEFDDINNMWAQLHIRSQANAVWFYNMELFPALSSMTHPGGHPAFMPWPQQLSGSPFATLLGKPAIPIEQASAPGDTGDIILCDPTQYLLGIRGSGIKSAVSPHLRFDYEQNAYRASMRFDGQPWWLTSVEPYLGANNISPFIVLS